MIAEFIDGLQQFHFLQNALITAIAIGIVAGAVGCFIILRGMSLMGDAISHAVLPGVALSFILGINFFIGAIVFGLLASVLITYIKSNSIIKSDTAIGITFSSFLALGVILIGVAKKFHRPFPHPLWEYLGRPRPGYVDTIGVGAAVLLVIVLLFRPLLLTSFDPRSGSVHGRPGQGLSLPSHGALDLGFCHCYAECRDHSHRCHAHHTRLRQPISMPIASGP